MNKKNISMAVIRRLPKYYRYINELLKNNVDAVSSNKLSEDLGFTASQIRNDFNNFGYFGRQGYGYNVKQLHKEISMILGLIKNYNTIIIGAGNIGQAVANYTNFGQLGFKLKGIFDINPKLTDLVINDIRVRDIDLVEEFICNKDIDIAILCVPRAVAQKICDTLIKGGIKGIWNFTQVDLITPKGVTVENVDLSDSLLTLSCLM